jgi:hypothetical protein
MDCRNALSTVGHLSQATTNKFVGDREARHLCLSGRPGTELNYAVEQLESNGFRAKNIADQLCKAPFESIPSCDLSPPLQTFGMIYLAK